MHSPSLKAEGAPERPLASLPLVDPAMNSSSARRDHIYGPPGPRRPMGASRPSRSAFRIPAVLLNPRYRAASAVVSGRSRAGASGPSGCLGARTPRSSSLTTRLAISSMAFTRRAASGWDRGRLAPLLTWREGCGSCVPCVPCIPVSGKSPSPLSFAAERKSAGLRSVAFRSRSEEPALVSIGWPVLGALGPAPLLDKGHLRRPGRVDTHEAPSAVAGFAEVEDDLHAERAEVGGEPAKDA